MASHYVFNLTYYPKVADLVTFLQEKLTSILIEIVVDQNENLKRTLLIKRNHMHLMLPCLCLICISKLCDMQNSKSLNSINHKPLLDNGSDVNYTNTTEEDYITQDDIPFSMLFDLSHCC